MERNEPYNRTASQRQGSDKYPGIDTYEYTTLKKDTRICALVAYYENGRMKPCEFYFPHKVLQQVDYNPIKLSQGLQISPWQTPKTGECCYRTWVATFIVAADFETEYSAKVSENPSYGTGGMIQYHIPKESAEKYLIKEPDDIFLSDGQISEEEYEVIMEKHQQILIKRNLFSYLKAKADTLDILQNTTDKEEEERTKRNLRTLDQHIEDLTIRNLNAIDTCRALDRQDGFKLLPNRRSLIGIHTLLRHIKDTGILIHTLKHIIAKRPGISSD